MASDNECSIEFSWSETDREYAGETNPFSEKDSLSDLTLIVEDKKLYVHKMILAKSSHYFRAMFYPETGTGFKEKDAKVIDLGEDKDYDEVVDFLIQLYPEHSLKPITDETLVGIMALADEYQVHYLLEKCEMYIKAQMKDMSLLSIDQIFMYLCMCERHRMPQHMNVLEAAAIQTKLEDMKRSKYFTRLSQEEQINLTVQRCQILDDLQSDVRVFMSTTLIDQPICRHGANATQRSLFQSEMPRVYTCQNCLLKAARQMFAKYI